MTIKYMSKIKIIVYGYRSIISVIKDSETQRAVRKVSDSSNFISSSSVNKQTSLDGWKVNDDCMYILTHRADLRSAAVLMFQH